MKASYIALLFPLLAGTCLSQNDNHPPKTDQEIRILEGKLQLAWDTVATPDPACFLDLETGRSYSISTAPEHAGEIDLYWCARPLYLDAVFSSTDDPTSLIGGADALRYNIDLNIPSWPQQNRTQIAPAYNITSADFDRIHSVDELLHLWKKDRPIKTWVNFSAQPQELEQVYTFETAGHKRGLIHFSAGAYGDAGYALYRIRIEP